MSLLLQIESYVPPEKEKQNVKMCPTENRSKNKNCFIFCYYKFKNCVQAES